MHWIFIRPLVLVLLKTGGFGKYFIVQDGKKGNKFNASPNKWWKAIETKIRDLKNIELSALPVFNYGYIKLKTRTCGNNVCNNFRRLIDPEDISNVNLLHSFLLILYLFI